MQEQARLKPKIEEMIPEYLDGEIRQSLFGFLEFCFANGIKIKWSATNRWKLAYKSTLVGMIYLAKCPCMPGGNKFEKNTWYIHVNMEEEVIRKENFTELIYKNVLPCVLDQKRCDKPYTVTVLGKEFKNACPVSGHRWTTPDVETLNCIQKMIEFKIETLSN